MLLASGITVKLVKTTILQVLFLLSSLGSQNWTFSLLQTPTIGHSPYFRLHELDNLSTSDSNDWTLSLLQNPTIGHPPYFRLQQVLIMAVGIDDGSFHCMFIM